MRHSRHDGDQDTMRSRSDGWSPELEQQRVEQDRVDEQVLDDERVEQRDRISRAGSVSGVAASWQDIKSRFVDDPQGAIAAAEDIVRHCVEQRIQALHQECESVCARAGDEDSSTEGLRNRLIRYQQYCAQLASTTAH